MPLSLSYISYLVYDPATGEVTGTGCSADGTFPSTINVGGVTRQVILATDAQVANASGSVVANGVIIPGTFVPPITTQAQLALSEGLTVTSNSTSSLNGVYPVDTSAQNHIQAEVISIMLSGNFADGSNAVAWTDMSGVNHTFNVAQFQSLALAIGAYVAALFKVINGSSTSLPPSTVTIV